jgi:hypothetical protein
MTRAEWIAAAAMGVNVLGFAFGGGAFWQTQQELKGRIENLEAVDRTREEQFTQMLVRLERIDANTTALKERLGDSH